MHLLPREEMAREPDPVPEPAEPPKWKLLPRKPLQRKRPPEPEKTLPRRKAKPTALDEPPELSGGGVTLNGEPCG